MCFAASRTLAAVSFERNIRPIFERRCASCHGEDKQRAGLSLATFADLMKGGDDGAVVVPGKSDESLLVKLIERREKPFMPPEKEGPPLTAEEIKVIRAWIDAGANGDGAAASDVKPQPPVPAPATQADVPASQPGGQLPPQISSLAFSPDGKVLAAGLLHVVELLNPSDGSVIRRLEGHMENVRALAFSRDGRLLAAGGGQPSVKGEVKIWSVADGKLVTTIAGHTDCIYGVAFSPDARSVATAGYDRLAYIWDAATGKQLHEFKNHVDAVYAVRFTTDGTRLLTASADRSVKAWDTQTGKHLYNLVESQGALYTLALSPDGKHIAAGGADQMIRIWRLGDTGGQMVKSWFAHERPVLCIAFSPDGTKLYSTSEDRLLKVWDADKQTEVHVFEPQSDWDLALAVAPAGGLLSVGRYDGSLAVYDAASYQRVVEKRQVAPRPEPDRPTKLTDAAASQPAPANADDGKFKKVGDFIPVSVTRGAVTIPPGLNSLNIKGAAPGSKLTLTIHGQNLDDISEVIIGDPGIRSRIVEAKALPKPKIERIKFNTLAEIVDGMVPWQLKLELTIGYEARPGFHEIRVRNARGLSNGLNFYVEDLSEVPEREPNDDIDHAQPITRAAVALGAINSVGDVDYYRFEVQPGQAYVFEVVGSALGSNLTGNMAVRKADGTILARSEDFGTMADVRVAFQPSEAGTYYVSIEDSVMMAGGFYRLRIADRAALTDAFPLGVEQGKTAEIAVKGVGLGDVKTVRVSGPKDPARGQEIGIPIDERNGGALTQLKLAVGRHPEATEAEPNDEPARAQPVTPPVTINGRIWREDGSADHDLYRFAARKGHPLVIDVNAHRLGSPLDSSIEVLTPEGARIERARLRSVAKTMLVLADRDSRQRGLRLEKSNDLEVRDYIMVGNELTRIWRLPGYPDEDTLMYDSRNLRRAFLGTTTQHHAVGAPVYKVQIHPPGSTFAPNGMPIFRLYTENDDGGPPTYGRDSVVTFDPPADGEYLVRIRSATADSDLRYVYRLSIRPPRPDFAAFVGPADVNVPAGASTLLTATVSRFDDFNGPIHIRMADLPEGFTASESVILPDEENANLVLTAGPGAGSDGPEWKARMIATADIGGVSVSHEARLRRITIADVKPDVEIRLEPQIVQLEPGGSAEVTVHVTRNNGFDGRVQIDARNLPFGTDVANTGLNGILITGNESQRTFRIVSFPWVQPMERLITVNGQPATNARMSYLNTALPITLRIGPPGDKPQIAGRVVQH